MKSINAILDKFGTDKMLHMFFGGWLTALFGTFGLWPLIVGIVFVFGISIVKEKLDGDFDWADIKFAMIGSGVSAVVCGLSILI